jgi:hypothetical protein
MNALAPGDLCVIIDHPAIAPCTHGFVGRTVVLVAICERLSHRTHAPYWRCSGASGVGVSHTVLRKIPPAPLDEGDLHEERVEYLASAIAQFRKRQHLEA